MNHIAGMLGEKIGDMVEDAVKNALGVEDKDKDDDKKKGGIFSLFGGDKEKEKEREREREREKEKDSDDEHGGFFHKIFHKHDGDCSDDEDKREKKSGFSGLFTELEGPDSQGGGGGDVGFTQGGGNISGMGERGTVGVNDGDLFDDLMDVAAESGGK